MSKVLNLDKLVMPLGLKGPVVVDLSRQEGAQLSQVLAVFIGALEQTGGNHAFRHERALAVDLMAKLGAVLEAVPSTKGRQR